MSVNGLTPRTTKKKTFLLFPLKKKILLKRDLNQLGICSRFNVHEMQPGTGRSSICTCTIIELSLVRFLAPVVHYQTRCFFNRSSTLKLQQQKDLIGSIVITKQTFVYHLLGQFMQFLLKLVQITAYALPKKAKHVLRGIPNFPKKYFGNHNGKVEDNQNWEISLYSLLHGFGCNTILL